MPAVLTLGAQWFTGVASTCRWQGCSFTPRVVLQRSVNILKTEDEWEMNSCAKCGFGSSSGRRGHPAAGMFCQGTLSAVPNRAAASGCRETFGLSRGIQGCSQPASEADVAGVLYQGTTSVVTNRQEKFRGCNPSGIPPLRQISQLIIQRRQRQLVLIARIYVLNRRLRLFQLRLAQFHDRTQPQLVARLRQLQPHVRCFEHFCVTAIFWYEVLLCSQASRTSRTTRSRRSRRFSCAACARILRLMRLRGIAKSS